jgi:hypothetical protein
MNEFTVNGFVVSVAKSEVLPNVVYEDGAKRGMHRDIAIGIVADGSSYQAEILGGGGAWVTSSTTITPEKVQRTPEGFVVECMVHTYVEDYSSYSMTRGPAVRRYQEKRTFLLKKV